MSKFSLIEDAKIIAAAPPKSYSSTAMSACYVSMKNYNRLTIVIQTGAWAAGTAAVTLLQATNVSAAGAKALGLSYMWTDEAVSGTLVKTAATANTFTIGTALKEYVIEIDADSLDVAGGFDCVTLAVASPGANADFYSTTYALTGARHHAGTPPSALTN